MTITKTISEPYVISASELELQAPTAKFSPSGTEKISLDWDGTSVGITTASNLLLDVTTPTTDVNAPAVLLKGASAYASATTAGTKRGGAISIESGRAATPGTDASGPIYIGLGDEVAGVTDIANGVMFGTGPAVGTPGADDYVPYTTSKGSLNVRYDRGCLNIGMVAAQTSAEPLYMYSNDLNQYIGIGNAGITMVVNGTTAFNAATIGTLTVTTPSTAQFQSTGGAAHLISQSANTCSLNGGYTRARTALDFAIENFNASFEYWKLVPASNLITQKWDNTGYAARKEERYFYGTTSSTATLDMAGRFTPSITDGLITFTWRITGSTASGATCYMRYQLDTYRIAAGIMTTLNSTMLAAHTNLASAPTIVASSTASGGTTLGLSVAAGDSVNTRWEAQTEVMYTASY